MGIAPRVYQDSGAGRLSRRTDRMGDGLQNLVPLQVLADELHVHVKTLRAAAHDGAFARCSW